MRTLAARSKNGDAKAVKSVEHLGILPAATWEGGLLNKLKIAPVIQAIANWFVPVKAYAYPNYSNKRNWPQSTDTDAWHQDAYNYRCLTWAGSSYGGGGRVVQWHKPEKIKCPNPACGKEHQYSGEDFHLAEGEPPLV